jgi:hypothetical protein
MGVELLGLLLAIFTTFIAALALVGLPAWLWPLMGMASFPIGLGLALLILVIGAVSYAAIKPS